ncbi:hypothetical protein HHI36_001447, partial [Cryptolaemus montrouzieri]
AVITKDLQAVIKKDDLILSLRHIKPKKRSRGSAETLFSIVFPGTDNKFAILLNRRTKKVIVETLERGKERVQHFTVDILEEDSTVKSLVLAMDQRQPGAHATLYIDCISYGMVATPKTIKEMFVNMDEPKVEVYHEKRYPMEIDGHRDVRTVLSMHECPLELDSKSLNSFDDESFLNNYLRDDPNAGVDPYGRGDIPSVSSLDEGTLLKALNELIRSVNSLYSKCGERDANIEWIRRYMEECDVCRRRPDPPPTRPPPPTTPEPTRPTCETAPPNCFRGVRCYETVQGPRCGPCPYGYTGNGYDCRPIRTCADRPCFPGVTCQDSSSGYTCGPCPTNYDGNGEQCRRTCRDNPCFQGVICDDTETGFRCRACPPGYEGNGEECRRRPSGCEYNPCAPGCAPSWRSEPRN